jgi:hypothetical protein
MSDEYGGDSSCDGGLNNGEWGGDDDEEIEQAEVQLSHGTHCKSTGCEGRCQER